MADGPGEPGIINPFATPTPSAAVTVENPAVGSVLTAGNEFTLEWSVSINRTFAIDILLSTDDGR